MSHADPGPLVRIHRAALDQIDAGRGPVAGELTEGWVSPLTSGPQPGGIAIAALVAARVEAPCPECGRLAWTFRGLRDDEWRCRRCAEDDRRTRRGSQDPAEEQRKAEQAIDERVGRCRVGRFPRLCEALGLAGTNRSPTLRDGQPHQRAAADAARRALGPQVRRRGLLILSGVSGVGKSTAAAWMAYETRGLYLDRATWTLAADFGDRARDLAAWALEHGGWLVIDNALDVAVGGDGTLRPRDSSREADLVFRLAADRHERHLGTVITTQSTEQQIARVYGTQGEALVRRARDGVDLSSVSAGGGFVLC